MQRLQQLKRNSVKIQDGMPVRWKRSNPGKLDVSEIVKGRDNEFTQNNGVIAFVHEGELYVTPYTKDVPKTLEAAGLTRTGNLFVPFSNTDLPEDPATLKKWQALKESAREHRSTHASHQASVGKTVVVPV